MKSNKNIIAYTSVVLILIITIFTITSNNKGQENNIIDSKELKATIISINDDTIKANDKNNIIYTFSIDNILAEVGDDILIEYTGLLDENKEHQNVNIINYSTITTSNEDEIPEKLQDNGIFSDYYTLAYNKVKTLTLEEKIVN